MKQSSMTLDYNRAISQVHGSWNCIVRCRQPSGFNGQAFDVKSEGPEFDHW